MQHEVAVVLVAVDIVEELLVLDCSECCDCKALGLASGEQGASMGSCKNSDLTGDGSDFLDSSAVDSLAVVEDAGSENLVCKIVEELCNLLVSVLVLGDDICELLAGLILSLLEGIVAAFLAVSEAGLLDQGMSVLADGLQP